MHSTRSKGAKKVKCWGNIHTVRKKKKKIVKKVKKGKHKTLDFIFQSTHLVTVQKQTKKSINKCERRRVS